MVLKDITQTSLDAQQYVKALGQTYNSSNWGDDTNDYQTRSKVRKKARRYRRSVTLVSHDTEKRLQFLQDMESARNQLATFRQEMEGLATQINGISDDLHESKNRVHEIEQDLTETQEDNVNLQVLLERAVKSQKESDVFATQAIRSIHSDLNLVVLENNELQERLSSIEYMQREHKGNAHDTVARMREYVYMLEQAQDTIQLMQETTKYPSAASLTSTISISPPMHDPGLDSRRTSETSSSCISHLTGISVRIEQQPADKQQRSSSITAYPRIIHNRVVFLPSSPALPPRNDLSFIHPRQQHPYFEHKHHHHLLHHHQRRQSHLHHNRSHHQQQQQQQRKRRQTPLPQGLLLLLSD
ncbi:hypothetical protein [Absidia glauca]|uniref:Uncharacterized protein n=1 Tax=Absidia glauca TaxID=4829 RepID=A0A168QP74_ABSGL|nr:hypothetical protein [Absidia glauca]